MTKKEQISIAETLQQLTNSITLLNTRIENLENVSAPIIDKATKTVGEAKNILDLKVKLSNTIDETIKSLLSKEVDFATSVLFGKCAGAVLETKRDSLTKMLEIKYQQIFDNPSFLTEAFEKVIHEKLVKSLLATHSSMFDKVSNDINHNIEMNAKLKIAISNVLKEYTND